MQTKLMVLRRENNITQKELADLLKISVSSYRNKELGKKQFKADEMFTLAEKFNKPIEEIFLPN